MRSSTVLVISLRSIAHETIKNLVLAGIGRLIVMDGEKVTEEDLGSGFLFREEDGAVGTEVSSFLEYLADFYSGPRLLFPRSRR
jgi:ubiquitin-like 1-activating enzyme E1 A